MIGASTLLTLEEEKPLLFVEKLKALLLLPPEATARPLGGLPEISTRKRSAMGVLDPLVSGVT